MKKSVKVKLLTVFSLLFFVVQASGQLEGNPENLCRNGFFPRESSEYKLAKIKGKKGEKVYFYGDERDDCPGGKNCRLKSYVIPNNEVIVSRTFGKFACSWFQPKKGAETVGWISVEKLEISEPNKNPNLTDWLGKWRFYDNSIEIAKSKTANFLDITGNAIWKGLGDNVHIGELDDSSKPVGNELKIGENETGEYACKVTMRRVGRFLVVSDNFNCGGANVTFSGVYQRK